MQKTNIMQSETIPRLLFKMSFPMMLSMLIQALYNVVDSIFVANMKTSGALANEALTIAFPVQILKPRGCRELTLPAAPCVGLWWKQRQERRFSAPVSAIEYTL